MALEDEEDKHQPNGVETSEDPQSVLTLVTENFVEILARLPVDSLLRCRSVCKSWCSLISDPQFVKYHLAISTRNNHYAHHGLVFSSAPGQTLKTCRLYDLLYDNSINALDLYYTPEHLRQVDMIVGSCNGLVCIANASEVLFIWNPSTRKLHKLPNCGHMPPRGCYLMYGFGYEESTDDYKVVELSCNVGGRDKYETLVRIYSLKNGIWKKIGVFPHYFPFRDHGRFSNGALHWVASEDFGSWTIVSLDLAKETYGEVLQPVYDEGYMHLILGSLREWLCVLSNYGAIRMDLWVMKVYGVKDSWTKLVSIPYLTDPGMDRFSVPLCISNDGKLLLQFGWRKLIVYDSKNNSFSEIQNSVECIEACIFVESLVSPMPATSLGDRL